MRIACVALAISSLALVFCAACGGEGPPPDDGAIFIALPTHFNGYRDFQRFDVTAEGSDPVHTSGARRVYINQLPEPGSTRFPVGTIAVKEFDDSDKVFAMVKRGGSYNMNGASGWEWFEIKAVEAGVAIVWRGVTPPTGEGYSGTAGGACNDCHAGAVSNDYVQTPALLLSALR